MSRLKEIRDLLGLTQAELGTVIDCTQGNVGHYERDDKPQPFPPERAERLIAYATSKRINLTFDHIYGAKPLPAQKVRA